MFEYYPETHTYWLDGREIPSVTRLVSVYGPDMETDELEEMLAPATERGTVMHDYLMRRLTGEDPEDIEIPEEYREYADGVELFLAEHELEPEAIETPMYCHTRFDDFSFGGTPDYVGTLDGTPAILDWKFVSSLNKHKVSAQLAGYQMLTLDYLDYEPQLLAAVQFLPGTYRLYVAGKYSPGALFAPCLLLAYFKSSQFQRGTLTLKGEEDDHDDPV